jgi:hypothetical protein
LRLKGRAESSDPTPVRAPELSCPICQADIPLAGDEKPGDELYCTYCGAPCIIAGDAESPEEWAAEEDF